MNHKSDLVSSQNSNLSRECSSSSFRYYFTPCNVTKYPTTPRYFCRVRNLLQKDNWADFSNEDFKHSLQNCTSFALEYGYLSKITQQQGIYLVHQGSVPYTLKYICIAQRFINTGRKQWPSRYFSLLHTLMHVNELPELTFDYKTIFTVRNSSCGKVMFSQASVILSTEGHAWQGGMHGWGGGHTWQERWPLQRMVHILLECSFHSVPYGYKQPISISLATQLEDWQEIANQKAFPVPLDIVHTLFQNVQQCE